MVVDNMPGAGSMISANYTFKVAQPDGLTVGHFIGGLFLQQLLGKPGIEFDANRNSNSSACRLRTISFSACTNPPASPISTPGSPSKQVIKFGGVASGSGSVTIFPIFLKATIGLPTSIGFRL